MPSTLLASTLLESTVLESTPHRRSRVTVQRTGCGRETGGNGDEEGMESHRRRKKERKKRTGPGELFNSPITTSSTLYCIVLYCLITSIGLRLLPYAAC